MRKLVGKLLPVLCLAALCLGMTAYAASDTILKGVSIGQVDVSGMSREEASRALDSYTERVSGQSVSLVVGEHTVEAKLSDFGLAWSNEEVLDEAIGIGRVGNIVKRYKEQKDLQHSGKVLPLEWETDKALVKTFVQEQCTQYDRKAENASLTRENGSFNFVAGKQGLELDVDASVQAVVNYLENSLTEEDAERKVELVTKVTEPEGSAEELAHVKDLLGTFTTSFSTSSANRCKNLQSGAEHIDGTVLYPGEAFSTYETVAPFTEENGYAMAGSYLNGEVVDSMGGGICQVSTTLYNAILRAELEVTERSPHSMIVHYVELSEDAAIAGTYKDFKFVNSTKYPVYIEGYTTSDKRITFNVYGKETRDSNRTVTFESVKTGETPPQTVLTENGGLPLGHKSASKGSTAYTAELYKVVKVNGVETERTKVNKSSYRGSNRIVTYGTAGDPVLSENLRAAIALQDEALADANVAAANAAAAAAAPPGAMTGPGALPGDGLIAVWWAGLEGTSILAKAREEELLGRFSASFVEEAKALGRYVALAPKEEELLIPGVNAILSAGEGGVYTALWEFAKVCGLGFEVDLREIPLKQETVEICEYFHLNPYRLMSGGCILLASCDSYSLIRNLKREGIEAFFIGCFQKGCAKKILNGEDTAYLERPREDELYKIIDKGMQR